jgi:hypothetical protein
MRTTATGVSGPLDGRRDLLTDNTAKTEPHPIKEAFSLPDMSGKYTAPDALPGLRGVAISEQGPFLEIYATSFIALYRAWKKTMRGKSKSIAALSYSVNLYERLFALSEILTNREYEIKGYRVFWVYEPKQRLILAIDFESKIVLHALCDFILEMLLCASFIVDNYANQRGKGMHYGLNRLTLAMRDVYIKNKMREEERLRSIGAKMPRMKDWNYDQGWVIKGDIRKYFYSIDHYILIAMLAKKLAKMEDRKTAAFAFWLCELVINSTPNPGIPIGNQTSQLFALLYLDCLDHFIKDKLGIKHYGRYMDDFYIICASKKEAQEILKKIEAFVKELGLELNEKTQIFPLSHGLDFLGFHTYLTKTGKVVRIIRHKSKVNAKRRINMFRKKVDKGEKTLEDALRSHESWLAHAEHGNTRRLISAINRYFYSKFPELKGMGGPNGKALRIA